MDIASTLSAGAGGRVPAAATRHRRRWLHSPAVDLGLVYGGGLALATYFLVAARSGTGLVAGVALFGMVLDMPHVLTTSVRVLSDRDEFARHGRRYLISTSLCVGAAVAAAVSGRLDLAVVVWATWQFFHVVKQHIGMMLIYAGKARYAGSRLPLKVTIAAWAAAPLVVRAHDGLAFGHYEVGGRVLPFSDLAIPLPHPPLWLALPVYAVAAGALVALVAEARRAARRGGPLPAHVWLGVAVVAVSYNLAYLAVRDLLALIVIATATHALQYHLINWRRLAGTPAPGAGAAEPVAADPAPSALEGRRRIWLLAATALGAGAVASALETTPLYTLSIGLVIQHFYMDRYLWRASADPRLAVQLGLR